MEVENNGNLSYADVASLIRPEQKGPIHKTIVENRLTHIKQQKYQYYDGCSNVVGSPYKQNGVKNSNYTSPNFMSNAVFYDRSSNMALSNAEMYKTTTNLLH